MNGISDSEELANRFNLAELRHEAHSAEVHALPDFDDYGYWCWYWDVVNEAIAIKRATQPKPQKRPGYIDVDAIREKANIVSVVEEYGLKLHKAGRNFKALCPFHTEKTASFIVNPERQMWHCFGACNTGGDVFAFIQKMENCSFREAAAKVGAI